MLNNNINNNYFLVPVYCGEYNIKHDHELWADDGSESFKSSDIPNGVNGDWFEGLFLINPNKSSGHLVILQALVDLWTDILPNHGADDDVYDYIPDFINQIIYLAAQVSDQEFEVICQTIENIVKSEDPRHPGKSYREVFNEGESGDFKPLSEDFTTLKRESYLDQANYLKTKYIRPEDLNHIQ